MARKRKIIWQIYPFYLAISCLMLIIALVYSSMLLKDFYLNNTFNVLQNHAKLINLQVKDYLTNGDLSGIDDLCKAIDREISVRVTIILPDGTVIGDSDEEPAKMDNHANRPEVINAISNHFGESTRYSHTLDQNMMYVAIPSVSDEEIVGIIRCAMPVPLVASVLRTKYIEIALVGLIAAAIGAVISLFLAIRIYRPLRDLRLGAESFAKGQLHYRLYVPKPLEVSTLAESMNYMAGELEERIRTITQQRNELEVVLSSMVEAVIAVDNDEKIIRFNKAAGKLFMVDPKTVVGRPIQEVVRNPNLLMFATNTMNSDVTLEVDIEVSDPGRKYLKAYGSLLKDSKKKKIGALMVLHDISQIKKLENMRREFVANVSHELKTPITSIKGFVETLQDGAVNSPEDAHQFLEIILEHTERLDSIIEDLLYLSRIEQYAEDGQIELTQAKIHDVIVSAINLCSDKADEKNIEIQLKSDIMLSARISKHLIEMAVMNLITNAVKYSDPGSVIEVECYQKDIHAVISVKDHGCGIPEEHLGRIFERFYRVDKARSRKLGGTGLGLAIVKHIANAHFGNVDVASSAGKGSTFYINLPI